MALNYCCLGSESELGRVLRSSIGSRLLTRSTGSAARLLMRSHSVETGSGPCRGIVARVGLDSGPVRALLMRTCLADIAAPSIVDATRRVLERCGVDVVVPRRQTCCGQPGWSAGHPDEARRVARRALRAFRGEDPVVVPSGSCAAMVTHGYPELFAGLPEEDAARAMAGRTLELSQFLHRNRLRAASTAEGSVTLHDSCHMLRLLGERESARACLLYTSPSPRD